MQVRSRTHFQLRVSKFLSSNLFPCLFQLLGVAHIPWFIVLFHLKSQQWRMQSTHTLHPSIKSVLPFSFICKNQLGYIWPTRGTKDNIPILGQLINKTISSATYVSFTPRKVTYSQAPGMRAWVSLRGCYPAHLRLLTTLCPHGST